MWSVLFIVVLSLSSLIVLRSASFVCVFDGCECLRAGVLWHDVTGFLCIAEFRSPSHVTGLNRSASLSCTERVDSESISGSNSQLNNSPAAQYVPDFNVRALADLQYVKVCYAHQHSFSLVFTQVCVCVCVHDFRRLEI